MISFYILSARFSLKHEGLTDARIASITKKIWFFSTFSVVNHKIFKVNIWWMIIRNLLKFVFILNFHNKKMCNVLSLTPFSTLKYYCMITTREIFSSLALMNNSLTIGLAYLQSYHQKKLIFYVFYLGCVLECLYKYRPCHLSIQ